MCNATIHGNMNRLTRLVALASPAACTFAWLYRAAFLTAILSPFVVSAGCPCGRYEGTPNVCSACNSPSGSYCTGESTAPIYVLCPVGKYCTGRSQCPTSCRCGTYSSSVGATACSSCNSPSGSYCPEGSTTAGAALLCPVGSFCTGGSACPVRCACGTYSLLGASSCNECGRTPGYYCVASPNEIPCEAGYYCTGGCRYSCPCGSYCPSGSVAPTPCNTTIPALYCVANSAQQTGCSSGYYCPDTCTQIVCSAGYYCPPGSVAQTQCPCGYFCPQMSSTPLRCSAIGSYCPTRSSMSGTCADGYYCPDACTEMVCPPSYSCPTGSTEPTLCPCGYYCPGGTAGPISCGGMTCPAGSSALGGFFPGYYVPDGCTRVPCPAGSYCPGNTTVPEVCPVGHYCPPFFTAPVQCRNDNACPRVGMALPSYSLSSTHTQSSAASTTTTVSDLMSCSCASASLSLSVTTMVSPSETGTQTSRVSTTTTSSSSASVSNSVASPSLSSLDSASTTRSVTPYVSNSSSRGPTSTATETQTILSKTPTLLVEYVQARVFYTTDFFRSVDSLIQVGAVFSGISTSSSSVGRIVAARRVTVCSTVNVDEENGLLGSIAGSREQPEVRRSVGAIAGNAVFIVAGNAFFLTAALIYSARCGVRVVPNALLRVALPSTGYPLWIASVPTTTIAVVTLMVRFSELTEAADIAACIAAGFAIGGATLGFAAVVPLSLQPRWSLVLRRRPLATLCKPAESLQLNCASVLYGARVRVCAAVHRHSEWGSSSEFASQMRSLQALLLEYAALWYPLLDVAFLTFASVLAGVSSVGASGGLCSALSAAILVLYCTQLVTVAAARPFTTAIAHVGTVVSLSLTVLGVVLRIVYFSREKTVEELSWVQEAASACDLLALGVSLFRAMLELPMYASVIRLFSTELLRGCTTKDDRGALASAVVTVSSSVSIGESEVHNDKLFDTLLPLNGEHSNVPNDVLLIDSEWRTDVDFGSRIPQSVDLLRAFYTEQRLDCENELCDFYFGTACCPHYAASTDAVELPLC